MAIDTQGAGLLALGLGPAGILLGGSIAVMEEAKIEAALLRHAAIMARYDARFVELQADVAERDLRKKGSQITGAARAVAGASGFASDSGSNLEALEDIDRNIELNASVIQAQGRVKAGQIRDKARGLISQASTTETLGRARGATTLLSSSIDLLSLGLSAGAFSGGSGSGTG